MCASSRNFLFISREAQLKWELRDWWWRVACWCQLTQRRMSQSSLGKRIAFSAGVDYVVVEWLLTLWKFREWSRHVWAVPNVLATVVHRPALIQIQTTGQAYWNPVHKCMAWYISLRVMPITRALHDGVIGTSETGSASEQVQIASSYSLARTIIVIFQLGFATFTLSRADKSQISLYGLCCVPSDCCTLIPLALKSWMTTSYGASLLTGS